MLLTSRENQGFGLHGVRCVPGAKGHDLGPARIFVGGHLAHDHGAGGQVLGAFLAAQLGKLVRVKMSVGEPVGVHGVERGGPDENPCHGFQVGRRGQSDQHFVRWLVDGGRDDGRAGCL